MKVLTLCTDTADDYHQRNFEGLVIENTNETIAKEIIKYGFSVCKSYGWFDLEVYED